jgi:hypothetical protein
MLKISGGFVRRGPGTEAAKNPGYGARVMPTQEVIMTSATLRPYGAAGRHAEGRGYGLVIFAAVLLAVTGFFNLLDGIAAIANSRIFTGNAVYVIGDLRAWGWVMTIFGGVQLLAAAGVWAGNSRGVGR